MEWWHKHDEGRSERDQESRRHLIALAQLIAGVMIATAIIVYLAS